MFGVEGETFLKNALGEIEVSKLDGVFPHIIVGARRMLMMAVRERQREAFFQVLQTVRIVSENLGGAQIIKRMHAHFHVRVFGFDGERSLRPLYGFIHLVIQHVKLGTHRIRHSAFG